MDIAQLRQFVLVAERLNISHAAEAMNLTQPALSKSMQPLQRELGTSIYVRRAAAASSSPNAARRWCATRS
jgi:DNA-binding transcriptional LysR family regulator